MKSGIYIHIPFCEQRCYYCAFTVAVSREQSYAPYIDRVIREIELANWNEPVETIFLGGGTPSILHGELIRRVMRSLPAGAVEISLEANPGTLDSEKLQTYREVGINRISLGAQSFDDADLKATGRLHKAEDVFRDVESLRRAGFDNINLDLIAGLPNQKSEGWDFNLETVSRLRPEHVSIYMLELEELSPWSKTGLSVTAEESFIRFYQSACNALEAAGYVHYEISNWALPGRECLHNLKYWIGAPYRGFGVGAHSFDRTSRFWNSASLSDYAARIDEGSLPIETREVLTREMRIEEAILLGLRQIQGFSVRKLAEDLGIQYSAEWFKRVDDLQNEGLVQFDGSRLKLTPLGWLVATGVTEELLWPTLLSTSAAIL